MKQVTADHLTITVKNPLMYETTRDRAWFLFRERPITPAAWDVAEHLSRYWHYNRTLGCKYNQGVMNRMNTIPEER